MKACNFTKNKEFEAVLQGFLRQIGDKCYCRTTFGWKVIFAKHLTVSIYFWRLSFIVITFQLVTATMPKRNRNYSPSDMDQALEAIKSEYVDKKAGFKVADLHF